MRDADSIIILLCGVGVALFLFPFSSQPTLVEWLARLGVLAVACGLAWALKEPRQ